MTGDELAGIPMRWVGPMLVSGNVVSGEYEVPLATFETPLWPSVRRGAVISKNTERGIVATLVDERMTRSVLFETEDAAHALQTAQSLSARIDELQEVVAEASRFAKLLGINHQIVGNLLFVRFEFTTGDASGHNMATLS